MSVLFLSCIARPRKDNSCYGNNSLLHPVPTLFRSKLALTLQPPHFFFHSSISPGVQLLRNPSSRTGFPPCRQLSVFLSPAVMLPFLFTTSRSCFLSWSRGGGGGPRGRAAIWLLCKPQNMTPYKSASVSFCITSAEGQSIRKQVGSTIL